MMTDPQVEMTEVFGTEFRRFVNAKVSNSEQYLELTRNRQLTYNLLTDTYRLPLKFWSNLLRGESDDKS
jgi:hypothetical protein